MADHYGHLPRGPVGVFRAAQWSIQGLRAAWLHESSFRLEVCLFVVLAPLGWYFGNSGVERVLLIGSCILVMAMELMNSSMEAVVERFGNERHELIGRAKDMGSAAVFMFMMNVVLVWAVLLLPRWF